MHASTAFFGFGGTTKTIIELVTEIGEAVEGMDGMLIKFNTLREKREGDKAYYYEGGMLLKEIQKFKDRMNNRVGKLDMVYSKEAREFRVKKRAEYDVLAKTGVFYKIDENGKVVNNDQVSECDICKVVTLTDENVRYLPCTEQGGHTCCSDCADRLLQKRHPTCHICRAPFSNITFNERNGIENPREPTPVSILVNRLQARNERHTNIMDSLEGARGPRVRAVLADFVDSISRLDDMDSIWDDRRAAIMARHNRVIGSWRALPLNLRREYEAVNRDEARANRIRAREEDPDEGGRDTRRARANAFFKVLDGNKKEFQNGKECPMCFEQMDNEDDIEYLMCAGDRGHAMHKSCLSQWGKKTCPECRVSFGDDTTMTNEELVQFILEHRTNISDDLDARIAGLRTEPSILDRVISMFTRANATTGSNYNMVGGDKVTDDIENEDCCICLLPLLGQPLGYLPCRTNGGHVAHRDCLAGLHHRTCPECRAPFTMDSYTMRNNGDWINVDGPPPPPLTLRRQRANGLHNIIIPDVNLNTPPTIFPRDGDVFTFLPDEIRSNTTQRLSLLPFNENGPAPTPLIRRNAGGL